MFIFLQKAEYSMNDLHILAPHFPLHANLKLVFPFSTLIFVFSSLEELHRKRLHTKQTLYILQCWCLRRTKTFMSFAPKIFSSNPCSFASSKAVSTLAGVLFPTQTRNPLLAAFNARFTPMTARP